MSEKPGFPNTLDFSKKKNAVKSHFRQQVLYPLTGSTVNPNETPIISIPCGKYGTYLDPTNLYIQCTITNTDSTAATAFVLDGSAYSLIDRITCTSSGSPLTDVQYAAPLTQAILDMQVGVARGSGMSVAYGTVVDNQYNTNRGGVSIAQNGTVNVCMPLMLTAIDATFNSKLIPVGAIADLQVQFFMASVGNSVQTASTTANWKLSNFSLVADFIELDAGAQAEIDKLSNGKIQFSGEVWRGYQFSLNSGSSADTIVVPVKCQSAKSIYSIYRNTAVINNTAACSTVARINPFVSAATFYVNIGSESMPQIPLKNSAQFYIEMIKSQHGLYSPQAYQGQFNVTNWNLNSTTTTDAATAVGSFMVGLDLESFANKSEVCYSGVGITGGTVLNIVQTYGPSALAAAATQNVYMHCDAVVSIESGVMTLVY